MPVSRQGYLVFVSGLKGVNHPQNLLHIPPYVHGVIHDKAYFLVRVQYKYAPDSLGFALSGVNHAISQRDLFVKVSNNGEGYFYSGFFFNISYPGNMGRVAVYAQAQQLNPPLLQFGINLGKGNKFSGANWGKVCGVGKDNKPLAFKIFQFQNAVSSQSFKLGCDITYTGHGLSYFFHFILLF
ncbi:MAG: hypothetical protein JMHAAFGB_01106 [Dehalococcoides mccartyi]|nr:hypothetical protein [Dehalococcoides mccartyi]